MHTVSYANIREAGFAVVERVLLPGDVRQLANEMDEVDGFSAWSIKNGVPHVMAPASVLAQMATVRHNVDPSQVDNGPLCVLPGAHRWVILGAVRAASLRDCVAPRECLTAAGGAVVMSPLIPHSSAKSTTNGRRRVLHLEYASIDSPAPLRWRDCVSTNRCAVDRVERAP